MKVTVSADGEVVFDTEDVDQAVAMVKALRNGAAEPKPRSHKRKPISEQGESMPDRQGVVWTYLVDNNTTEGLTVPEIAKGMGIAEIEASRSLKGLLNRDKAHRVSRGHWRPGSGVTQVGDATEDHYPASKEPAETQ